MTAYYTLFGIIYFVYGICIGSFLNVCIYRIPRGLSIVRGGSMCTSCHHRLRPLDLIPIGSWLYRKGKCRYCAESVSRQYPLIECLTGTLYVACFLRFGPTAYSILLCLFFSCLIAAAAIDLEFTYVPDRIQLLILLLAGASSFLTPRISFQDGVLGSVIPAGIMLAVSMLTKGGIGGGDIKLIAATGLLLGFWRNMLAFLLAYLLAGLFYVIPLIKGYINGKDEIPMVPFFAASLILSALFGGEILCWYFQSLFGIGN